MSAHEKVPDTSLHNIAMPESYHLDWIRALAVNLVLFGHLGKISGIAPGIGFLGGVGVEIFFFLSGYLITQTTITRIGKGQFTLGNFVIDRFARIYTPLVPAILLIALIPLAYNFPPPQGGGNDRGLYAVVGNLLSLQDYPLFQVVKRFFSSDAFYVRPLVTFEQSWTLPIEWWTYVFFGMVVWVWVQGKQATLAFWLLFVISVPVVFWNAFAGGAGGLTVTWAVGAASAGAVRWLRSCQTLSLDRLGLFCTFLGLTLYLCRMAKTGASGHEIQATLFLCMSIFGLILHSTKNVASPQFTRMAGALSSYSYSLYLLHNSVIRLVFEPEWLRDITPTAKVLIAVGFAHLASYAFYLVFEAKYRTVARMMKRNSGKPLN